MAARQPGRQWPWMEVAVLALAAGIVGLWFWWLTHGARLAHAQTVTLRPGAPAEAASAPSLEQLGQVGDLFGGLNALFVALAFVGVAWAGLLQHRALRSAEAAYRMERQAMVRQRFEQTFFHLLALSRDLSQAPLDGVRASGAAPLLLLFDHLAKIVTSAAGVPTVDCPAPSSLPAELEPLGRMVASYLGIDQQQAHASVLGGYFRTLYQLFALIDEVPDEVMSPAEKSRYANIVRGQIPESAVLLLALNALTERGGKLAAVIDRHGLLKYLPSRHQPDQSPLLARVYRRTAFIGFHERLRLVAQVHPSPDEDIDQTRACLLNLSRGGVR